MKGDAQPLIKFFDGSDKRFIIPLYQRTTTGKKREEHDLRNRIMHVDWNKVENETISQSANHEVQSAKAGEELPPKCKNCTLEEVALLRIVQKNPSATQKEIATEIGKSERTVKSITIALQEKNIIRRVNGKRNGYWEFVDDSI